MTVAELIRRLYRHGQATRVRMEDIGDQPDDTGTLDVCGVVERNGDVVLTLTTPSCQFSPTGEHKPFLVVPNGNVTACLFCGDTL